MNPTELYSERLNNFSKSLSKTESQIKSISIARLIIAAGIILTFYFSLTYSLLLFYLFFFLSVLFSILVIVHSKFFKKKNLLHNYIRINTEELKSLNGNNESFDKGSEFEDHKHPYTYDLDIFGKGSLFEFICRTVTYSGKIRLAQNLSAPVFNEKEIFERQTAIKELRDNLEYRQDFRARGLLLNENKNDSYKIKSWLEENNHFTSLKFLKYLIYILPVISLTALTYALIKWEWNIVLFVSIISNGIVYGNYSKKINELYEQISKKKLVLENYSELLRLTENIKFNTPLLNNIHSSIKDGSNELKKLSRYVGWFDQRANILFSPVANTFFLFDLHCCFLIEKWKEKNKHKVNQWLGGLGEIDSLSSYGNLAYNNSDFIFPEIVNNKPFLESQDLTHPLLKKAKRIPNNFSLGIIEQTAIITGANMAGKSTFLRSVGTNLVLAYAAAPVCASHFKASILNIYSSMRISDSLKDQTSYFYAELQRLKQIKHSLESGQKCLVLLDEMLKGTNSNDKQQGSKAFVQSLLQYTCLAIVATHDLELGKLEPENPGKIKNFCFESFLSDNHLTFDYKIREGTAKNTNASFLMKDLGII